ncbi:MAG TPA: PhnD/SsuA/transferrin family substrate-binding protein [Gemmataceae bacterium]|jgi:ABC-type phosphate/phosphonate transport system substrate-binding protein|nr:PhnD/SsuA/transferrin family substrate-binding protein [Gemmataceae bacterium]
MKQLILVAALIVTLNPWAAPAGEKEVYRIGIAKGVVRDVPQGLLSIAGDPFRELMKIQTGLNGAVTFDHEWPALARNLNDGKLELGVLQGHEFGWARQKYPDLQALVCSIARPKPLIAYLLVRHDCNAGDLADLKDGKLVMATALTDHARLFLAKRQAEEMGGSVFRSTATVDTVHEAIQKVIAEEGDLTVTDHAAWSYFQKLYPGASKNLKVLAKSEEFPPTVLVYKKGSLDEIALKKLRDGLVTSHETAKVARMMGLVRIEKFVAVPDGFEETIAACLKSYPAPRTQK